MNDDVHHPQASIHISTTKHLHTRKRFRFKCLAEYVFSIVHMENAGLLEEEEGGRGTLQSFPRGCQKNTKLFASTVDTNPEHKV